MTNQEALHWD